MSRRFVLLFILGLSSNILFQNGVHADSTMIGGVADINNGYMVWCCTAASQQDMGGYLTQQIQLLPNSNASAVCGPGEGIVSFQYLGQNANPLGVPIAYVGCAPIATQTCAWVEATACPYYGYMSPGQQYGPSPGGNNPPWPAINSAYPPGIEPG